MPTVADDVTNQEILREIHELETRIQVLRTRLVPEVKSFYLFRCEPENKVLTYANSLEQARKRVTARMSKNYGKYGEGWKFSVSKVDVLTPVEASNQSPGNLLRSVPESEAREFLADYDQEQRNKPPKKNKDQGPSRLEKDIESYRIHLAMKEKRR